MAFVVEDGTGLSTATAYCSVDDADTYHTLHGAPSAWTNATTAQKEAAIMAATVYMDATFSWKGEVTSTDQALGWPRDGVVDGEDRDVDSDIVPTRVQDCCAYLALQHINSALDQTYSRGGAIKRQKVGTLEIEYMSGAPTGTTTPYATQIVWPLINNRIGMVTIQRA